MACTGCTSKFSFLRQASTCSVCNYSFCAKCLQKKSQGIGSKKVCQKCCEKVDNVPEIEPPALLLKRLESLENPAKPPIVVYNADRRLSSLKRGLSEVDKEIVERLEKLKEDRDSLVPTESEIQKRLRALQGKDISIEAKTVNTTFIPKPAQQQVDDLLMEYMDEMKLSEKPIDLENDLEKRLAAIKETIVPSQSNYKDMDVESDNEDEAAARIIKRAMEEAALPACDDISPPNVSPLDWEPAESELPWCELCNGDAAVRCIDCDGALYCRRCLKESHDSFEIRHHKTVPFESKPKLLE